MPPDFVVDLHCDTVLETRGGADIVEGNPTGHVDVPRLRQGSVGVQFFACFVPQAFPQGRAFREAQCLLEEVQRVCDGSRDALIAVESAVEARDVASSGRATAVVRTVENGHAIEDDLSKLERLRVLGARAMTLTHSRNLSWAASSGEARCDFAGLTPFGRKVVAAMNEMGMIVDVSHVHESTFWDVVKVCRRPFVASHSCAAALCPTPRNLSDDQIRAIADAGGVVGVNFFPGFLDRAYAGKQEEILGDLFEALEAVEKLGLEDAAARREGYRRLSAELRGRMGPFRPDIDRVADHVLHVIERVGDEHVAIGSDFDGVPDLPAGLEDCGKLPALIERLAARGLSDASLAKVASANVLRVLEAND